MRTVLLFILSLLLGICVGGACVAIFLRVSYKNETVTEGGAFGLTIGQSKRQVFDNVGVAFQQLSPTDTRIFMEVKVDEALAKALGMTSGQTAMVQTHLESSVFGRLESQDNWRFYVNGSYFNSLSLTFCQERLCEIHRHRKFFELP